MVTRLRTVQQSPRAPANFARADPELERPASAGGTAGREPRRAGGTVARASRWFQLVFAVLTALGALAPVGAAWALPPHARLDADERERLRDELREQWRDRARTRDERPRNRGEGPPAGYQQRRHDGDAYRGPDGGGGWGGNRGHRMSPEERQQLRMQLRERHRQHDRDGNGRGMRRGER